VLDYLLEDARLDIEAITGTSAGAMNAVVLAEGYLEGGRAGARKNLARFWRSVSDADVFPPAERKFLNLFFKLPLPSMVTQWWADYLTHYSSPYDFNPLNINRLRDHLEKTVDFAKVRASPPHQQILQLEPINRSSEASERAVSYRNAKAKPRFESNQNGR
jgi:NTE family protein